MKPFHVPLRRSPTARVLRRGAALAVVGLALACSQDAAGTPTDGTQALAIKEPDPIAVSVAPSVRRPMSAVYSTSGTLRAERQAIVTSRTRGVIEEIFVEEGDVVTANQPLAQLENNEQLLALDRYEMIHGMKSREYERSKELADEDLISNSELEIISQVVEELEHELSLARLELERTTVAAPFEGTITARHLDLGATVSDGTDIFELADLDPLYLDVSVPERHVARLAAGQTVQLHSDVAAMSAEARIERLSPVVDTTTGTVKVTVAVDSAVSLRPGAFVEIDVVTDVRADALVVPRSALVAEGRRWLLYRVAPVGDRAELLEVEIGFEQGPLVEIAATLRGEALQPGQAVVVRGASALSDGARLTIVESGDAEPVGILAEDEHEPGGAHDATHDATGDATGDETGDESGDETADAAGQAGVEADVDAAAVQDVTTTDGDATQSTG